MFSVQYSVFQHTVLSMVLPGLNSILHQFLKRYLISKSRCLSNFCAYDKEQYFVLDIIVYGKMCLFTILMLNICGVAMLMVTPWTVTPQTKRKVCSG